MATREYPKIRIRPHGLDESVYGPVEVAWHDDRLTITAVGAWRATLREEPLTDAGQQVVIEIRPPERLEETVPGAD
ncbi:MAG TPA: hypothetical protein VFJ91_05415 [Gaiellaceae bacterium]|nr:hypothetical protein [Gaiellaceae bacterium]